MRTGRRHSQARAYERDASFEVIATAGWVDEPGLYISLPHADTDELDLGELDATRAAITDDVATHSRGAAPFTRFV